ncbi:ribonuclease H-like domain-containing protein [Tanacetum coccineum]
MTHPSPKRNMVPKAVLMRSGLVSLTTAKPVYTAQPRTTQDLQGKGVIDSGCSRHMTGYMSYLIDYEEIDGGYIAFGGNPKGGKSLAENSVLFNDTECVVLSPNFKLTDESHVLLKVPRKNNMYSVDLKNIVTKGGLTCLFAKATSDESKLWHRRLGHINIKTMNKLVKGNLVRGSGPNWLFDIDALTKSMNYKPVVAGNQSNGNAGTKACDDAGKARMETVPGKDYILLPLWTADPPFSQSSKSSPDDGSKPSSDDEKKVDEDPRKDSKSIDQENDDNVNSTNNVNAASINEVNVVG